MLEVFDELNIPAVLAINGSAIKSYEGISRTALDRGWAFMGHCFSQKNMQKVENEREDIVRTRDAIRAFVGRAPRGWLGPGLTETWETPDLLVEEGFDYVADWVLDDQPVRLKNAHETDRQYTLHASAIDQFEQIYKDSLHSARVVALVVHPYIMGAPHRLRYFREALQHRRRRSDVLFWTGEPIHDWFVAVTT
jgi:allantoinase